ncbi:MAG: hypothetical protein IJY60_06895 [Bacteroides sp.]|nr:hypothetical protein [Bacteroides sp.]MBQ8875014.1 hypothetical protein [Bacteroides sp.]
MSEVFTCIGRGHGAPTLPVTRKEWEELRNEPWLDKMCKRILQGDERLKAKLPVWTPGCAEFKDNHRSMADALKPLPRLMLDFDEKGHSAEILKKALELQEQGKWEILLVEESVRKGTHVLITLPKGMTPQEAQTLFSKDVGFQADPALKDVASRCIYMVPAANTLYVSEKLFDFRHGLHGLHGTRPLPNEASGHNDDTEICDMLLNESKNKSASSNQPKATEAQENENPCNPWNPCLKMYPQTYNGIPYTQIVETLEEQMGGKPEHGSRNNFIFSMACHLRYICNDDADWIASILPTYGEASEKWMASIRSACARNQAKVMPRIMLRTLSVCKKMLRYTQDESQGDAQASASNVSAPPEMPANLPPLIELLTSKVPAPMKPAVANAVFPPLGAHLKRVSFRYVDNTLREATFMCCLLAKMSSGKSAVNKPIEFILADIVERDEENRRREQAWKDSINQKGANKEKPKRPEDLCIQVLVSDMTNAAFVQRLSDANGKFLYTNLEELELMNQLKTSNRANQVSQIIRLAFDCGLYGQERVGTSSVTARVKVRWNWNASSTIQRGCQFFRNALSDGTLSRINFCSIEPQNNGEIPVYGTYDDAFAEALKPYIDHLNEATGLVECKEAEELARQLLKENAETALLSDDEVYESLSYRANVIAYLKAMTLYVANGCVWDKRFEDFIRWSERYDLYYKLRFFGESMKVEMEKENWVNQRGPQNMLCLLPERFTTADAVEVRRQLGKDSNVKPMLKTWVHRGYICKDECTGEFYKTKKHPDSRS